MALRQTQLNRTLVELADTLVNDFDVVEFLHTLATRCVALFDVDAAGIMLAAERGALGVVGAADEQTSMLELFEIQSHEGPCSECYRSGHIVSEHDLETTDRWPRFRHEALNTGVRAALAVPLSLRDENLGALNLFRAEPGGLDDDDLAACQALADVATIALIQERALREARLVAEQLQRALDSRVVIEQAKGVLAGLANVDMHTAFKLLRGYARAENLLLVEAASAVIAGRLMLGRPGPGSGEGGSYQDPRRDSESAHVV